MKKPNVNTLHNPKTFRILQASKLKHNSTMKYLVNDLLDKNQMVSHLFLDCVSDSVNNIDVIHKITNQEDYNINTTEVDIQLLFNGMEVKIDKFLEQFRKQYFKYVDEAASEKFHKMFPELEYKDFIELEEKVNSFVDEFKTKIVNKYKVDIER